MSDLMSRRPSGCGFSSPILAALVLSTACAGDTPARRAPQRLADAATPKHEGGDEPSPGADAHPAGPVEAGSEIRCRNSLDCRSAPAEKSICDPVYERCVECVSNDDCPTNSECVLSACVAFVPCENSLACPGAKVCDRTLARCVDCVTNQDCDPGLVCVNAFCLLACQSDKQCTQFGLLCDTAAGHCVQCLRDTDCRDDQYCLVGPGACVPDRCVQGSSTCRDGSLSRCADNGSALLAPQACGAGEVCVETATGAACGCTQDSSCAVP